MYIRLPNYFNEPFAKQHSKLIKGCKANERAAQESLYKLFYTDMLRLCHGYLKSDELSKEALNMGFLKVFQHIGTFDEKKGELEGWIRTIIIRTCIDLGRKEIRFSKEISVLKGAEDVFMPPAVLNKLYAEDLLKYICLLPDATRLVFNLSVIEGYSHGEIGEQLNIGESTSRWHLSEGKKMLRGMLTSSSSQINKPTENNNKII
jgi:RNA polymerase sigma factor (sigma-70 family)